jgi:hypothetical protein
VILPKNVEANSSTSLTFGTIDYSPWPSSNVQLSEFMNVAVVWALDIIKSPALMRLDVGLVSFMAIRRKIV